MLSFYRVIEEIEKIKKDLCLRNGLSLCRVINKYHANGWWSKYDDKRKLIVIEYYGGEYKTVDSYCGMFVGNYELRKWYNSDYEEVSYEKRV